MSRDDRHGDPPRREPPGPDAPVTPTEQSRAEAFGRWVEGMLSGEPLPPAMDSDDRALLETATVVVASSRALELDRDRARALVDRALEAAVVGRGEGDAGASTWSSPPDRAPGGPGDMIAVVPADDPGDDAAESDAARSTTQMIRARRRTDRVVRNLPWVVASIAAAAAVVLFVTRSPAPSGRRAGRPTASSPTRTPHPVRLSLENTSRSADPLIGVIARAQADRARDRIDIVFADRLSGYRDLTLRRELGKEQP